MRAVFADTFYWIALTNPDDSRFQDAAALDDTVAGVTIYTTEEVLAELLTFFAGNAWLRSRAVATVREILNDSKVWVVPQSHQSFLAGLELYAARLDKGYSLVDCISMQTMRREGLTQVLTNHRHFQQEGFQVLFRSA